MVEPLIQKVIALKVKEKKGKVIVLRAIGVESMYLSNKTNPLLCVTNPGSMCWGKKIPGESSR
jgi:hypothetical protein